MKKLTIIFALLITSSAFAQFDVYTATGAQTNASNTFSVPQTFNGITNNGAVYGDTVAAHVIKPYAGQDLSIGDTNTFPSKGQLYFNNADAETYLWNGSDTKIALGSGFADIATGSLTVHTTGTSGFAIYSTAFGSSAIAILTGLGTPEGNVTASVGSMYLRTDGGAGTVLYIKESGTNTNTGWVGK